MCGRWSTTFFLVPGGVFLAAVLLLAWLLLDTRSDLAETNLQLQATELDLIEAQTQADEAQALALKLEQLVNQLSASGSGAAPVDLPLSAVMALDDGAERISFRSLKDGPSSFYSIRPDGTGLVRLTTGAGGLYSDWSPDGRSLLVEVGSGGGSFAVVMSDGSGSRKLDAEGREGSWSPDARSMVYVSNANGVYNTEIYVADSDGKNARRLTTNDAPDFNPQFSPDGAKIAFARYVSGSLDSAELFVMNADGSNEVRLTDNAAPDMHPEWSPDGSKLVFESRRDGNSEIYIIDVSSRTVTRLTENAVPDYDPTWSPDGRRIAFWSVRDFGPGLFVMNADGSDQTKLDAAGQASGPSWRAASR